MNIKLYKNTSPDNAINKNLTAEVSLNGNLIEDCNILNPSILIDFNAAYVKYNYIYIPDFQRYYFIREMVVENGMIRMNLHVDVLMSFKSEIYNSNGTATRSNYRNDKIKDDMVMEVPSVKVQYRKLGTALTGETYVAIIGG